MQKQIIDIIDILLELDSHDGLTLINNHVTRCKLRSIKGSLDAVTITAATDAFDSLIADSGKCGTVDVREFSANIKVAEFEYECHRCGTSTAEMHLCGERHIPTQEQLRSKPGLEPVAKEILRCPNCKVESNWFQLRRKELIQIIPGHDKTAATHIALPAFYNGQNNGEIEPLITPNMKAICIGEFIVPVDNDCTECSDMECADEASQCEYCDGEGSISGAVQIPWITIKVAHRLATGSRRAASHNSPV